MIEGESHPSAPPQSGLAEETRKTTEDKVFESNTKEFESICSEESDSITVADNYSSEEAVQGNIESTPVDSGNKTATMDAVSYKVKKGQLKSKLREVRLSIDLLDPGNYDLTHKDDYNNEINSVKDKVMELVKRYQHCSRRT